MPSRIPRPCRKHGCPHTTTAQYGYCDQHKYEGWVQHQRGRTRQQQGDGRQWEILRARILKRDKYFCQPCLRKGIATEAKAVDHIQAKAFGGTDDEANLQAICQACHRTKTASERFH
ncbi:MAG: HNH endonuclease [Candidatus Arsenophonus phytopathogenicus]